MESQENWLISGNKTGVLDHVAINEQVMDWMLFLSYF